MPAADHVETRYTSTAGLDDATLAAEATLLSDEERERAGRLTFARHRRDFIAAHVLLRRALSDWHPIAPRDWTFVRGQGGKPELSPTLARATGLTFNLAHTDGFVACAIAHGAEIGVDVEAVDRDRDVDALARRYFSGTERAHLGACAREIVGRRFIEIWTLKEAFVKATGAGITRALDTFSFEVGEDMSVTFEPPPDERDRAWHFALFAPQATYRIAVAVCGGPAHRFVMTATEWPV